MISLGAALLLVVGTTAARAAAPAWAEDSACADCHEDKVKSYEASSHGYKGDTHNPASKHGCQTCHGPGQAHVDAGGGRGVSILDLSEKSKLTAEERSSVCQTCHAKGKPAMWHGSSHQQRGLSCMSCHDVHGGRDKNLKTDTQMELCSSCHKDVRTQLLRNSHHPVREGKVTCSDCHNPHGAVAEKNIDAASINDKCYSCHAEYRGPFLWSHAPVREECTTCHTPHGSTHDRLLKQRPPYLCMRCHNQSGHQGTWAQNSTVAGNTIYETTGSRLFSRGCVNCHPNIHGSNHPSGAYFTR